MEHDELKLLKKNITKLSKTLSSDRFVALTKGLGLGNTIPASKNNDFEKKEPTFQPPHPIQQAKIPDPVAQHPQPIQQTIIPTPVAQPIQPPQPIQQAKIPTPVAQPIQPPQPIQQAKIPTPVAQPIQPPQPIQQAKIPTPVAQPPQPIKVQLVPEIQKKIPQQKKMTRTTNEILFKKQASLPKTLKTPLLKKTIFYFLAHGFDLGIIFIFSILVYLSIQTWIIDDSLSKQEFRLLWDWFQKRELWKIGFITYFLYFAYWCVFKIVAQETLGKYLLRTIKR